MKRVGCCLQIALLSGAILLGGTLTQAPAVVVSSTTTGNTTAPADDFGFANVGVKGGTTGVYLGYRWVLTAAHVSAADIELNGRIYADIPGTRVEVTNPTGMGLTEYTDLALFRIAEDPYLPTLKIADDYMDIWDEVVMMGHGTNRQEELLAWNIEGAYHGAEDWVWTRTDPPGDALGHFMATDRTLRWGTNVVEQGLYAVTVNDTDVVAFKTDFDYYGGTEFEAQATTGDSGGGVFHKRDGQWELVGILHAVTSFPNQPASAFVYGNETWCSDLSVYRDQILAIITPLPGDANLDGVVDLQDASIMAANWGQTDTVWGHGDFNEDGVIDELDAAILADNWGPGGTTEQALPEAGEAAVPEPGTMGLILGGLAGLLVALSRGRGSARA